MARRGMHSDGRPYNYGVTRPGTIGAFIREERERRGWSQQELINAADLKITQTDISRIELDKTHWPNPNTLDAIARAFGMRPITLLARSRYGDAGIGFDSQFEEELASLDAPHLELVQLFVKFLNGEDLSAIHLTDVQKVQLASFIPQIVQQVQQNPTDARPD
jgi:transcriptional regulator with XRE-family HTH domain